MGALENYTNGEKDSLTLSGVLLGIFFKEMVLDSYSRAIVSLININFFTDFKMNKKHLVWNDRPAYFIYKLIYRAKLICVIDLDIVFK